MLAPFLIQEGSSYISLKLAHSVSLVDRTLRPLIGGRPEETRLSFPALDLFLLGFPTCFWRSFVDSRILHIQ